LIPVGDVSVTRDSTSLSELSLVARERDDGIDEMELWVDENSATSMALEIETDVWSSENSNSDCAAEGVDNAE
jgi:hypothetical protein